MLPLFSLIVLLLPYAPVLPDQWPVLQALAGPLGAIVWLTVAVLQVWVLWQSRLITARAIERWSVTAITIAIFVVDRGRRRPRRAAAHRHLALSVGRRAALPRDRAEPVARRRPEDREQPSTRRLPRVLPGDLEPHYLTRGTDGEIYSIHPIGIAVMLAPIYALAGYKGAVWALILMGALAAGAWRGAGRWPR